MPITPASDTPTHKPLEITITAEPHPGGRLTGLREPLIDADGDGIEAVLALGILPPGILWLSINNDTWKISLSDLFRQALAQAVPDAVENTGEGE